jgi:hypothetical protein
MEIVKDWTTLELIEFMNSYKHVPNTDKLKYAYLKNAVHNELITRQPLMGMIY